MVSIIIVCLGEDEMLGQCIDSIREHTLSIEYEIIIVNNAPIPLSREYRVFASVIENRHNLGFARAVNRGILNSRGKYILLLNVDSMFTSDALYPMVQFMESHPKAGICGVQLIFPDGRLQNSIDIIPGLINQVINRSLLKILFPGAYPSKRSHLDMPTKVPSVIGACMMIRRSVLDKTGLMDEGFFFYLEETDLCKRAKDKGFEIWHLPGIRVVHYQGASARQHDVRRKIEFQRSMYRFFLKHRGLANAALLYIFTMFKLLVEVMTNLPFSIIPGVRARLKRSAWLFLWHLFGVPGGWGLEDVKATYDVIKKAGYAWFMRGDYGIPESIGDPSILMQSEHMKTVAISRTAHVKLGDLSGVRVYLKEYYFKGIMDGLKNIFRKSRALKSFEAAIRLEDLGVDTPRPMFCCEKRICRVLTKSFIATYAVDAPNLIGYASRNTMAIGDFGLIALFIRRIHEMGILPVDLKGDNLLFDHGKRHLYLIDLDRLRIKRFLTWRRIAKNLSYLYASFASDVPGGMHPHFLDEYIKGNPYLEKRKQRLSEMIDKYTRLRLAQRYS